MTAGIATQRYLLRHIEPGLPDSPHPATPWRNVLVIPAYREGAALADMEATKADDTSTKGASRRVH